MFYLIYKITNKINGKIYVGKHQTSDINDNYMGSGKILHEAFNKYGIENFEKEILFECSSLEEMNQKEKEIVNEEFVRRKDTYNIKLGGEGGFDYINNNHLWDLSVRFKSNERTKQLSKMANDKKKELYKDEKYLDKVSKKISTGLNKYYENNDSVWLGKKHKEETKIKIGKSNIKSHLGERNVSFGTCWVSNMVLRESKQIDINDLEKYLIIGWIKKRVCNWDTQPIIKGDIKLELKNKQKLEDEEFKRNQEYFSKLFEIYKVLGFNSMKEKTNYKYDIRAFRESIQKYLNKNLDGSDRS